MENWVKDHGKSAQPNWERAAKWKERFIRQISSGEGRNTPEERIDLSWINQYIHEMIDASLPHMGAHPGEKKTGQSTPEEKQGTPRRINHMIYEIFGYTIVRVPLLHETDPEKVTIWIDSYELILAIAEDVKERIRLPNKVVPEESKAYYRDEMIEIRLREDPNPQYVEIPIERL